MELVGLRKPVIISGFLGYPLILFESGEFIPFNYQQTHSPSKNQKTSENGRKRPKNVRLKSSKVMISGSKSLSCKVISLFSTLNHGSERKHRQNGTSSDVLFGCPCL